MKCNAKYAFRRIRKIFHQKFPIYSMYFDCNITRSQFTRPACAYVYHTVDASGVFANAVTDRSQSKKTNYNDSNSQIVAPQTKNLLSQVSAKGGSILKEFKSMASASSGRHYSLDNQIREKTKTRFSLACVIGGFLPASHALQTAQADPAACRRTHCAACTRLCKKNSGLLSPRSYCTEL